MGNLVGHWEDFVLRKMGSHAGLYAEDPVFLHSSSCPQKNVTQK